jgi:hypothetical protein
MTLPKLDSDIDETPPKARADRTTQDDDDADPLQRRNRRSR